LIYSRLIAVKKEGHADHADLKVKPVLEGYQEVPEQPEQQV
jgi:hypothetical protein